MEEVNRDLYTLGMMCDYIGYKSYCSNIWSDILSARMSDSYVSNVTTNYITLLLAVTVGVVRARATSN